MKSHTRKGQKEHIKCSQCEYSCDSQSTLKKHVNTKHQITKEASSDAESESEGEYDLFQLEIVSDEEVYVCNLCDEGFYSEYEVKKHLKELLRKFLNFMRNENVINVFR